MDSVNFTVETTNFGDIAVEFHDRVARMVWCNVATVDELCRPRSRIMHPIWEGSTGWIGTWATSVKSGHQTRSLKLAQLERNPHVSLAYVADIMKPVYIDAQVEVIESIEGKSTFSDLARSLPPPYGYDPIDFFGAPGDPRFAVLRLAPSRIAVVDFPAPPGKVMVWRG